MATGYAKVAWRDVCLPTEEGGQGIRDIQALNYSLMCRRLWTLWWSDRTLSGLSGLDTTAFAIPLSGLSISCRIVGMAETH
ncbi:UNVERIFIED_CONTAM: hypothetical protein Slati_4222300 [Sesamum latifolium]|uniref:Uncharacterized protein n=1 Tax=Sesamum latifolium TaxID=2727402 RepID=A0AAW2TAX0_9LAMI